MEGITVAEQIKALIVQLNADVERTKQDHATAVLALRDALVAFKPAPKGRPANVKRVRKPKQTVIPGTEE